MKFLKLFALLLISISSFGQKYYSNVVTPIHWQDGKFDTLHIPYKDTVVSGDRSAGQIVLRPTDKVIYAWDGSKWFAVASTGTGGGTYTLPQSTPTVLGGIKYNTDFYIDANGRLGIDTAKKNLWNQIALLPFYSTTLQMRGEIRDTANAHNLTFNPVWFNRTGNFIDFISPAYVEKDSIFTNSPAASLTVDNMSDINAITDTSIHPTTTYVRSLFGSIKKDTITFNRAHFYKKADSTVNLNIRSINGIKLYGDTTNIVISGGGSTDTTNLHKQDSINAAAIATKQNQLNGTGLVRAASTSITYDNTSYVPTSRTITINGATFDLTSNPTWTIAGGVTSFNGRTGSIIPSLSDYSAYYAAINHSHAISDVTGLQPALDLKPDSVTINTGPVVDTLVNYYGNLAVPTGTISKHEDGLVSGGVVTSGSGLSVDVTGATYYINGKLYTSPAGSIALNAADPALDRQDVIAVNTSGQLVKKTGTSAVNPIEPQTDPATELPLTSVYISAGATSINGISTNVIYNENAVGEWTPAATGITSDANNTVAPFSGTKAWSLGAWTSGDLATLTNGTTFDKTTLTTFKFYIRLKSVIASTSSINIKFFNGATAASNELSIVNYGLNKNTVGSYMNISMPISAFSFTSNTFNKVQIRFGGSNASGVYIDYVQFQNGIATTTNANFVSSNFARNDSLFYIANNKQIFFYKAPSSTGTYFPLQGGSITGTGGNGYVGFIPQSVNPTTPASGFKLFATSPGAFAWLTAQGYARELRVRAQTQNNIYYLQDKSYTLADSADVAGKLNITDTLNKWLPKTTVIPTNNNQLTNGAGFITNATGLVSAGTNVTITGTGTTASPYVVNSTSSGGGTGWNLSGNSINPSTDFLGTTGNSSLKIRTNNIERVIFDSVGNIKMGVDTFKATTTPLKFSMGGTYGNSTAGNANNLKFIVYKDQTSSYGIGISAGKMEVQANNGGMGFYSSGTEAMRLTNLGVGIGATTPSYPLDFGSALANTKIALYNGTALYGLGVQASQFRLHLGSSSDKFSFLVSAAGSELFAIKGTGGVVLTPMTKAQRDALASPEQGRMVFVSDNGGYLSYYNAGWFKVSAVAD